jgi:HPt (histidine-containing phosphotransfer) domain-containing protein
MLDKWVPQYRAPDTEHTEDVYGRHAAAQPAVPAQTSEHDFPALATIMAAHGISREQAARIVAQFEAQYADTCTALHQAADHGDVTTMKKLAHGLRGAAANLGCGPVAREAQALETACNTNNKNDVAHHVTTLQKRYADFTHTYADILSDADTATSQQTDRFDHTALARMIGPSRIAGLSNAYRIGDMDSIIRTAQHLRQDEPSLQRFAEHLEHLASSFSERQLEQEITNLQHCTTSSARSTPDDA